MVSRPGPWGPAELVFLSCVAAFSLVSVPPLLSPAGPLGLLLLSLFLRWDEAGDQVLPWAGSLLSFCSPAAGAGWVRTLWEELDRSTLSPLKVPTYTAQSLLSIQKKLIFCRIKFLSPFVATIFICEDRFFFFFFKKAMYDLIWTCQKTDVFYSQDCR